MEERISVINLGIIQYETRYNSPMNYFKMYHRVFVLISSEYIPVYEIRYHLKSDNMHLNFIETETTLSVRYTKPKQ